MAKKFDSVIFDLDGTLSDAVDEIAETWNEAAQQLGITGRTVDRQNLMPLMGLLLSDIGKGLFPDADEDIREAIVRDSSRLTVERLYSRGGKLYPELRETLECLTKKVKIYIVSNCQMGYIEAFLHAHDMGDLFADFESAGGTGLDKAGNISLIIKRNNLCAPVYVGDTQNDRKSAAEAGVPFVFASYGFGHVEDYDYKINSFRELKNII